MCPVAAVPMHPVGAVPVPASTRAADPRGPVGAWDFPAAVLVVQAVLVDQVDSVVREDSAADRVVGAGGADAPSAVDVRCGALASGC